ncbi:MAG: AraC family transcriptional regulator [Pseudomonadota bacterium]
MSLDEAVPPLAPDAYENVAIYQITQATTATFTDLYLRLTFLFFIESGSKRVVTSTQDVVGEEGDLLVFPAGSMVTMENRPVFDREYRAFGVAFPEPKVTQVFSSKAAISGPGNVEILSAAPHTPLQLLPLLRSTLNDPSLPDVVRQHRLLEPLIWLRSKGVNLSYSKDEDPLGRVRQLIETDLSHAWRADEVAGALAMSEATMRRWLRRNDQGFAKILMNTRLEHGLSLLQTTGEPISTIALDCGFKTPSHFSEAFKKRFGIAPRQIRTATAA